VAVLSVSRPKFPSQAIVSELKRRPRAPHSKNQIPARALPSPFGQLDRFGSPSYKGQSATRNCVPWRAMRSICWRPVSGYESLRAFHGMGVEQAVARPRA
jgi:hypothetical protein